MTLPAYQSMVRYLQIVKASTLVHECVNNIVIELYFILISITILSLSYILFSFQLLSLPELYKSISATNEHKQANSTRFHKFFNKNSIISNLIL